MTRDRLDQFEDKIGYAFTDRSLLERALTHASHGDGRGAGADNQRLEFLGDRVLGLLAAEALVRRFISLSEGELAPRLNALVRRETCAAAARAMGVGPALALSASEAKRGGREKLSILADACEAVMAGVYLDGGLGAARGVFERFWSQALETLEARPQDPKSALQERAAAKKLEPPEYRVVDRTGPEHRPVFTIEVSVPNFGAATGRGGSKRDAEREAATALLTQLEDSRGRHA